jgi:transcriptional regulator with XRE-family HTH domain
VRVNTSALLMRRKLGEMIKSLRQDAGLTQQQVAKKLGGKFSENRMSYLERGAGWPDEPELKKLLTLFQVSAEARIGAEVLLREGKSLAGNWWDRYRGFLSPDLQHIFACEATATAVYAYTGGYIPGVLQTEEYIRVLFNYGRSRESAADRDQHLKIRMKRREILESPNAPIFHFLCSEAALLAQVGGPHAMRDQLDSLARSMTLDSVHLRVLPFDSPVMPAVMIPFQISEVHGDEGPGFASTEKNYGDDLVEDSEGVTVLKEKFETLWATALSEGESLERIKSVAKEMVQ